MTKFFSVLAFGAWFVPASLFAQAGNQRFTRDGITYVYSVTPANDGRQVIEGRQLPSNSAFRLIVDGKRVRGDWSGQPVSFRKPPLNFTPAVASR